MLVFLKAARPTVALRFNHNENEANLKVNPKTNRKSFLLELGFRVNIWVIQQLYKVIHVLVQVFIGRDKIFALPVLYDHFSMFVSRQGLFVFEN